LRGLIRRGALAPWILTAVAGLGLACGGGVNDDPILRLSAEEAFAMGKKLMTDEKYDQAREHFAHAFQTAPNSEFGRDALLLQSDCYFEAGGEFNLIRAEAKYRDFNNRYPTSDRGDYVQSQIARSLEGRKRKPNRDQTETKKAIAAFEELLALYPTSEYAEEAEAGIARLRVSLAEHEFGVARYQFRRGLLGASVNRLKYLVDNYPEYPETDKALCMMGQAMRRLKQTDEAQKIFEQLRTEYPQSTLCKSIPRGAAE